MKAAIVNIYSMEISFVGEVTELHDLPDDQRWLTEAEWLAAPRLGQLWQNNLPASFIDPTADAGAGG